MIQECRQKLKGVYKFYTASLKMKKIALRSTGLLCPRRNWIFVFLLFAWSVFRNVWSQNGRRSFFKLWKIMGRK